MGKYRIFESGGNTYIESMDYEKPYISPEEKQQYRDACKRRSRIGLIWGPASIIAYIIIVIYSFNILSNIEITDTPISITSYWLMKIALTIAGTLASWYITGKYKYGDGFFSSLIIAFIASFLTVNLDPNSSARFTIQALFFIITIIRIFTD